MMQETEGQKPLADSTESVVREVSPNFYDLIIIGAGSAGLSAAIYMARAKYKVLVLEKEQIGGQIRITDELVNYPGILRTDGRELTSRMREQAEAFGAEFALAEVLNMNLEGDIKKLSTTRGEYQALAVVLAVGANPRKVGFKGEKEFQGHGVAYCATCDGEFFSGKPVFVLGGGFAAVEEGIFLAKYASHVRLVVRGENFSCAKTVADKLLGMKNVDAIFNTELVELQGDAMPQKALFRNRRTGETSEFVDQNGFGVFVFAGYVPNTQWLPKTIELDPAGYILTDRNQKTNLDGVYAAGDVCVKNLRQVVTAVADGAIAATAAEKHVSNLHEKLGIPELETRPARHKPSLETLAESKDERGFLDAQMRSQLKAVFEKFENPILLKAWLNEAPLSAEIVGFLEELTSLTNRVTWTRAEGTSEGEAPEIAPSIEICRADGSSVGIHFHGVPGGHEINSFIVAMYNVAGPGQAIDEETKIKIQALEKKTSVRILVSLSCTMCPETVMSAQRIASLSDNVSAEMIDMAHFPEWKEKYNVMSVPCTIINDSKVVFGKKNLQEVLNIIAQD
ncbi:MAG: FAD-dependent oxidoreductase [Planctomycetia bacterium]|nr:FAD-dependent oxidoreductase [Planctomycetia bacterium]